MDVYIAMYKQQKMPRSFDKFHSLKDWIKTLKEIDCQYKIKLRKYALNRDNFCLKDADSVIQRVKI